MNEQILLTFINPIFDSISLIFLVIASFQDLKSKSIDDFIVYGYLALSAIYFIISIYTSYTFVGKLALTFILEKILLITLALLFSLLKLWGEADFYFFVSFALRFTNLLKLLLLFIISSSIIFYLNTAYIIAFKKKKILDRSVKLKNLPYIIPFFAPIFIIFFINLEFVLKLCLFNILLIIPCLIYYNWLEEEFIIEKKVDELIPGDWILDNYKVDQNIFGITAKGIEKLKKMGVKKVRVKEGIAMIPSFLLTYVLYLILPNYLFMPF